MSEAAAKANDSVSVLSKRSVKFTLKGLALYLKTCQEKRSLKCKHVKRSMDKMCDLMVSIDNVNSVQAELSKCIKCFEEAKDIHEAIVNLNLPEDEVERQNVYFHAKGSVFSNFIEKVKCWSSDAGHPYVQSNDAEKPLGNLSVASDEINPEDSVSNVSCQEENRSRARSKLSKASSTSSARIKAEADKAALMERMAALKRKHALEEKEEKLRKEKERFALETELAAANAKLNVLEISSKCGSKGSNAMNSYFDRNWTGAQGTRPLNLHADDFVPQMNAANNSESKAHMEAQAVTVTPVHATITQTDVRPPLTTNTHVSVRPGRAATTQTDTCPVISPTHTASMVPNTLNLPRNNNPCNDIMDIMQRQNDITALLVQQNLASALPVRNIPVFDGDPLQFKSFLRAFENCVEGKTNNASDCLSFLEQYTRGQPRDLVRSCQHLPPSVGYQRAKFLLMEHFGNEHKITSAYMEKILNWPPIKTEDVPTLQSFSLFLRGCSNLTQQIMYMKELDMPSNLKIIVMKLPYKLCEKWRSVACDLQEQNGCRVMFTDLVTFVEKQAKILSDPLFGNIQDLSSVSRSKASNVSHTKQRRNGGTFATSVSALTLHCCSTG